MAAPGATVIVRGGTYHEAVTVSNSGTAAAPITFEPYTGEHVTIDGTGMSVNSLVNINANYINFQGFEVANSPGHGFVAYATHNVGILNNDVHGGVTTAIWVGGDSLGQSYSNLIQGNSVYNNVLSNQTRNGTWGQGITANISDNTQIIGNSVYDNYGEGIGSLMSSGVTIAGNTLHDNFSMNIYGDNAPDTLVDGNFIYSTGNTAFYINGHQAEGIGFARENTSIARTLDAETIINNIDVGDRDGFYYGNYERGGGLQNSLIANNTFVNDTNAALNIEADAASGNRIENNIFYRASSGSLALGSAAGYSLDYNDWFGALPGVFAGSNDLLSDPMMVSPGSLSPDAYRLQSGSPAIGAGATLSQSASDFSGTPRVVPYDIGAF